MQCRKKLSSFAGQRRLDSRRLFPAQDRHFLTTVQTASTPPKGREAHVDLELSFAAGAASDVARPSVQDRGNENMPALRWSTHRPSHARRPSSAAFLNSCSVSSGCGVDTRLVRVGLLYGSGPRADSQDRLRLHSLRRRAGELYVRSALDRGLTALRTASVISFGQKIPRRPCHSSRMDAIVSRPASRVRCQNERLARTAHSRQPRSSLAAVSSRAAQAPPLSPLLSPHGLE